jgi:glycosyltransferase involved in cell wall biosynthesis
MCAASLDPAPLIVEGLYSYYIGGSERVGADLALAFRDRGYRVVCFGMYGNKGPFRDELENRGLECLDLSYLSRPRGLRRLIYPWEIFRLLKRTRAHALHVHHAVALVHCGIAARMAGTPHVVMTEHAIHQLQERPAYRKQAASHCRYATAVTAVTQGIADYFRDELHVPQARLHTIPNGVRSIRREEAAARRMRESLGIAPGTLLIVYVGRLEEVKDLPTLLGASSRAMERDARIHLALIGDGSMRSHLTDLSRQLGMEGRTHFLGARQDVPALLSAADIFAMSSRTEGLPMAMVEAMSAALPCVSTAVGGIPELLADDCGVLAPVGDADALASAFLRLANDAQARTGMGQKARRKVEELYGLDAVVDRYLELMDLPARWPASC